MSARSTVGKVIIRLTRVFHAGWLAPSGPLRRRAERHHGALHLPTAEHIVGELGRLRSRPNCVIVAPGARHWSIFLDLVARSRARGNLVPDAYLAACLNGQPFGFWSPSLAPADLAIYHPDRERRWVDYTGTPPAYYGDPGDNLADLGQQAPAVRDDLAHAHARGVGVRLGEQRDAAGELAYGHVRDGVHPQYVADVRAERVDRQPIAGAHGRYEDRPSQRAMAATIASAAAASLSNAW